MDERDCTTHRTVFQRAVPSLHLLTLGFHVLSDRFDEQQFGKAGEHRIRFDALGVRAGQSVRVVRDGEAPRTLPVEADEFAHEEVIRVSGPTFVRFELLEDGEPVVVTNPLRLDVATPGDDAP